MKTPYRYIPLLTPAYRGLRRVCRGWLHAGNAVRCPVCERSFRGWLHHPDYGICPYCGSAPRQRLLCLYLADNRRPGRSPAEVLFFAPDWSLERWLRRRGEFRCVTTDLASPGVDLRADITNLPLTDQSFDLILCSHVLEHVPDDAKAIAELFRVVRPGGTVLVQVPYESAAEQTDEDPALTDPRERTRRFGQFDHVRLYGRDLVNRLERPGFDVQTVHMMRRFDAPQVKQLGLWDDPIFVCQKPA